MNGGILSPFLPVIPAPSPGARASRPQSRAGRHFPQPHHSRVPTPLFPPYPRYSRESGNPEGRSQARYPKSSAACAGGTPALPGAASRQNQDFQDSSGARLRRGKRSSALVLAGFAVMAKSASRAKRNPENPGNPENPDSDEKTRGLSPPRPLDCGISPLSDGSAAGRGQSPVAGDRRDRRRPPESSPSAERFSASALSSALCGSLSRGF